MLFGPSLQPIKIHWLLPNSPFTASFFNHTKKLIRRLSADNRENQAQKLSGCGAMETTEVGIGTQEQQGPRRAFDHRAGRLNKYTLFCALFASTNSILLGYGESIPFKLLSFLNNCYDVFNLWIELMFKNRYVKVKCPQAYIYTWLRLKRLFFAI